MVQNPAVLLVTLRVRWRRANHYLRRTNRLYSRLIAEAEKKPKSRDEVENLYGEWQAECEPEQFEVDRLLTLYYLRSLRVITYHGLTITTLDTGRLTNSEVCRGSPMPESTSSTALYEKRKRRSHIWIPLIAALTGLIAAATGFAAILLSHR
jgi:hypothetical protein